MQEERYGDLIQLAAAIHEVLRGGKLHMRMKNASIWGDGWAFWWPDERALERNEPWRLMRSLALDGFDGKSGLPTLRSRNHEAHPGITAKEAAHLARYGYAFTHMPHITLGLLRQGADLPSAVLDVAPIDIDLTNLVIAKRGPYGTIREVLLAFEL